MTPDILNRIESAGFTVTTVEPFAGGWLVFVEDWPIGRGGKRLVDPTSRAYKVPGYCGAYGEMPGKGKFIQIRSDPHDYD